MNLILYFIRRAKLTYPKVLMNFRKMVPVSFNSYPVII